MSVKYRPLFPPKKSGRFGKKCEICQAFGCFSMFLVSLKAPTFLGRLVLYGKFQTYHFLGCSVFYGKFECSHFLL